MLPEAEFALQREEVLGQLHACIDGKGQELKKITYKHWKMQEALTDVAGYQIK